MRASPWVFALVGLSQCGADKPPADPSREVLDRLDAIDRRLEALDARLDAQRAAATAAAATDAVPSDVTDPMRPDATARARLAITVTRTGFEVEGRTLTEAQLELLLHGVESVTVRADPGLPSERMTAALDLVAKSGIKRVAVASFSDDPAP